MPEDADLRGIERTVKCVRHRAKVYAGLGQLQCEDAAAGNEYFHAGADAVVARPPVSFPVPQLLPWFRALLSRLEGPLILYNMPSTTNISIPLDLVAELVGHPRLAGIKDSENSPKRLDELLRRFGAQEQFSIFVGVGALMAGSSAFRSSNSGFGSKPRDFSEEVLAWPIWKLCPSICSNWALQNVLRDRTKLAL